MTSVSVLSANQLKDRLVINESNIDDDDQPGLRYWARPDSASQCGFQLTGTLESPHVHVTRDGRTKLKILPNILHHIGDTPLVRINRLGKTLGLRCQILAKCESFNASGSVKDRIGLRMIEDAEASGRLRPGDTIIEPTSGNTGIALALAAAVKGYRCIIVMPEKMSKEKVDVLKALGAEVVRTPTGAKFDSPESLFGVAKRLLSEIPRSHILDQYRNPSNPVAHYDGTAEEILEACDGKVDMVVCTTGTGGTLAGISKKIKLRCPNAKMIGVDPLGSIMAAPDEINKTDVTYYEIEGIGYDFVPTVCDRTYVDRWYKSTDKESFQMARRMMREEGLLVGGSAGAAMYCALQAAKDYNLTADQKVVVILPDSVRNYMTKFLSDDWMRERNFLEPEKEIIEQKPWWWKEPISRLLLNTPLSLNSSISIQSALKLFEQESVDQVLVASDNGKLLGVVSLASITTLATNGKVKLTDTIERFVNKQIQQLTSESTLGELSNFLNKDNFVVIFQNQKYYADNEINTENRKTLVGIATRINLLNFVLGAGYNNDVTSGQPANGASDEVVDK